MHGSIDPKHTSTCSNVSATSLTLPRSTVPTIKSSRLPATGALRLLDRYSMSNWRSALLRSRTRWLPPHLLISIPQRVSAPAVLALALLSSTGLDSAQGEGSARVWTGTSTTRSVGGKPARFLPSFTSDDGGYLREGSAYRREQGVPPMVPRTGLIILGLEY
jgi:hypothetical protein